jgi:hypothetical protein
LDVLTAEGAEGAEKEKRRDKERSLQVVEDCWRYCQILALGMLFNVGFCDFRLNRYCGIKPIF